MIGISADFDPVHKGHVKLIEKGKEIGKETGDEVVIYLNKGFSANHAPFFVSYEARKEMALEAGADRVVPIEGLHHRLTLAYTVPIRIAMMIEDGVVDYVDAANVSTPTIIKHAKKFAKKEIFSGIPRNLPNRNVIRWFAVNEFLYKKYKKKMKFHIIPELEMGGKISGREIRRAIVENDMKIPPEVKSLLPHTTTKILEREIKKGNVAPGRNLEAITKRMNTYSRSSLMQIAHLNADAINSIIKGRVYRQEDQIWAAFRRAGYGPVLTRLAISALEEDISKEEVLHLIRSYEKKGIVPPDQTIEKVIERSWFVAKKSEEGFKSSEAHQKFMNGEKIKDSSPLAFDAGLSVRSFEVDYLKDDLPANIYVDQNGLLACELRTEGKKIKSPLKLPGVMVTYLRLLLDSQFIPVSARVIKKARGIRIRIYVGKSN
ncbi:nucleotidyltransferase family protein [Methanobacterium alkalithermotolerans]|uniref:Nucleotidyltransferase family protein n=1 Tax=Methanobacterium alkalithermotolerans TaxID=2731220 RepID=A0A8T8K841_9EURY|nr:adenylyltransferase/cytidyltransferase family protein [Methanobacterium alkalithermotolerans]QUH23725.1 nucleotidyltransferase family protein [Methanobacterium alkalithermotolerans]